MVADTRIADVPLKIKNALYHVYRSNDPNLDLMFRSRMCSASCHAALRHMQLCDGLILPPLVTLPLTPPPPPP